MTKNLKSVFVKLAILLSISIPGFVFAASPFLKPVKDLLGDLEIFINFLNWALPALGVLIFFFLVIRFVYYRATGEAAKADPMTLVWGVVALAVMFAVYGLIQLLGALFGIDTNRAKTITAPSLPQVGGIRGGGYYNN